MKMRSLKLLTGTWFLVSQMAGAYQIPTEATFTNGQIAQILTIAYQHEVQTADLASAKSTSAGVKKFAETLRQHHTKDLNELNAMLAREKIALEESEVATNLTSQLNSAHERLENLSGVQFDRAFLDHQIVCHKTAIDMISSVAILQATNAALRTKLQNDLPTLRGHLLIARALKAKIGH